jgi:hypothetical protein
VLFKGVGKDGKRKSKADADAVTDNTPSFPQKRESRKKSHRRGRLDPRLRGDDGKKK